jgi:uncharacterized protein
VTPVFEELLFRGVFWNKMSDTGMNDKSIYWWNVALFALWHIGYMSSQIVDGNWSAVLTKVGAAFLYGLILCYVRTKTKNCYSTMLVHGTINLFAF